MGYVDDKSNQGDRREPVEGLFDAQLSFDAPYVQAPQPLTTIIKRDGREAPFDKQKIADAILHAAQSIGGDDRTRAECLASAVAIYLAKKLNGRPPTSDQVDDAVEKVLIDMGHTRTALAYVRFRDRRARVRRLRAGDTGVILSEWAEALGERDTPAVSSEGGLFVRTSAERLKTWDRARIAEALVRETGLAKSLADVIAVEVERQVVSAKVKTLTTSLVRELVSAKLVEHGFEEHRRRHTRLGVPLYDAEHIICGPGLGEPRDPEATDRVLAESVKREFALSQVLSPDVANAHVRGDLHVHDLGRVDRLHSSVQSLQYVARFGVGLPNARAFSRPPKYPDTLLAQMVNFGAALQNHFAGAIAWDAVNVVFAPFLEGVDRQGLRQLAQMLVYEYAYRAVTRGDRAPVSEIGVCWDVPPHLIHADAVGPGGVFTGRTYGDYENAAQKLAWAVFDILKEGGVHGRPFPAPVAVVPISPGFFKTPGHEDFLCHVAEVSSLQGNVHFAFRRADGFGETLEPWAPREVVVQRVTLNVARAAYRADDADALVADLEHGLELALGAHVQKRDFIERLLALKAQGPLGLLAVERDGRPYLDMPRAVYLVGLTGLNEAAQGLLGEEVHASEESAALACAVVSRLSAQCRQSCENLDLRCVLASTPDANVSARFASLDLDAFPDHARQTVKSDPATHEIFYTSGVQPNPLAPLTPMARARIEGRLHDHLEANAATVVRMPDSETSGRSVADFVRKVFYETACRRIALVG